jgi:hypothetical protein
VMAAAAAAAVVAVVVVVVHVFQLGYSCLGRCNHSGYIALYIS